MTRARCPSAWPPRFLTIVLICAPLWLPALAEESADPGDAATQTRHEPAPGERPTISASRFEQISEGEMRLTGDVDLRYGEMRLLADTVDYNDTTHFARAEGNVVLIFGKSQISGDRLEMDIETRLATIWNAHGYMDPDVIFQAEKLERIADDKVVITNGTVTTCTQPTPYWSFHVSKATLQQGHYAYMHNASFNVSKAPVIYLPYLIWPMKEDRSSGLLLPNVGYSRRRGSFIGNALYLVMGRSQDVTLFYDKYGKTGTGLGYEYRFVPAPHGEGSFLGYYLEDTLTDQKRYRFKLTETQQFGNGFRLLADLNKVSDLNYFLDFERDITQTTSPTVFSHVDMVRNWSNYALNVRLDRQEQFLSTSSDLTLQRLPEMELRGRGIRFGRSPFYLSFESSAGVFNRNQRFLDPNGPQDPLDPNSHVTRRETTYDRFDVFPTISASFSPTPWLDISPSVSARETVYSRGLVDPNDPTSFTTGKDVARDFTAFNLSMVGPRFFRLFGDPNDTAATRYKHTFEPRLVYSYIPAVSGGDKIIRFDEVDSLRGDVNQLTYSLTSRLFSNRPAKIPSLPPIGATAPYAADITGPTQVQAPVTELKSLPDELKQALKDTRGAPGVGSVEIATFDVSQAYSFDPMTKLSRAFPVEPDGSPGEPLDARAGPVITTLRYNPTSAASLDVRTTYDILFDTVSSVSMSANLRSLTHGYLRLSWFLNRDLQGRAVDPDPLDPNNPLERQFFDSSQLRLIGGTSFLQRKITLDVEGSYDIENHDLRDQRYRIGYNTQCCGMLAEIAKRDFQTIDEIQYRFALSLRGVGTFLDLQGGAPR